MMLKLKAYVCAALMTTTMGLGNVSGSGITPSFDELMDTIKQKPLVVNAKFPDGLPEALEKDRAFLKRQCPWLTEDVLTFLKDAPRYINPVSAISISSIKGGEYSAFWLSVVQEARKNKGLPEASVPLVWHAGSSHTVWVLVKGKYERDIFVDFYTKEEDDDWEFDDMILGNTEVKWVWTQEEDEPKRSFHQWIYEVYLVQEQAHI